jgi:hypothetical protein
LALNAVVPSGAASAPREDPINPDDGVVVVGPHQPWLTTEDFLAARDSNLNQILE